MKKSAASLFYSGISGLQLPVPKYLFPPPFENASRLRYYASLFNSIEINSSFYKIPQPATVAKWAADVPDSFTFTFKLFKEITHVKGLNFKEDDIVSFMKAIHPANDKKGCLLIQFPPSVNKKYADQVAHLLTCIRENDAEQSWNIAVEFRNKSWYTDATYELLNTFKAALVIHDMPESATPSIEHASGFVYIRFHGPTGSYRDSYDHDFLHEYATYIIEWLNAGKEVYLYFNNTMGSAINNLNTLIDFVKQKSTAE